MPAQPNITKAANKMINGSKNTKLWLMVGGFILIIGVIYMLASNRSSHTEGFAEESGAPLNWDQDKEVMVVFHKMKTCPYCIDFQKEWDEVYKIAPGEVKSKKNKTCKMVVVPPGHSIEQTSAPVKGYPTMRIYKSPSKFVEFEEERTKDNMLKFIMDNA